MPRSCTITASKLISASCSGFLLVREGRTALSAEGFALMSKSLVEPEDLLLTTCDGASSVALDVMQSRSSTPKAFACSRLFVGVELLADRELPDLSHGRCAVGA